MLEVKCTSINSVVEVDEFGRFELPNRMYTTTELRKVAREISKALRNNTTLETMKLEEFE